MEKEELEKLIDGMADRKYKLLTRFLVLSGLRIGELIALEKSDVDIAGRVIHVTKNRQAVTQETGLPKNSTSYRDVYMQDELASVCAEINQLIEMLGIKSKLFFPNADGDYLRHDAISKYFRENSEKILGRRVTPHMLRHTHVSLVVEASLLAGTPISLDDIAERLGHANIRQILCEKQSTVNLTRYTSCNKSYEIPTEKIKKAPKALILKDFWGLVQ